MEKMSIDVVRINRMMRIKFSLITSSIDNQGKVQTSLSKLAFGGNTYLKVTPNPYITIDISDNFKNEGYDINHSININRIGRLILIRELQTFISAFYKQKNLFFTMNGELRVNEQLANEIQFSVSGTGALSGKVMKFLPYVVPDTSIVPYSETADSANDNKVEGCIFFINNMNNFCYLSIPDIELLISVLQEINMTTTSLQLIQLKGLFSDVESKTIERKPLTEEVNEPREEERKDRFVAPSTSGAIPDI